MAGMGIGAGGCGSGRGECARPASQSYNDHHSPLLSSSSPPSPPPPRPHILPRGPSQPLPPAMSASQGGPYVFPSWYSYLNESNLLLESASGLPVRFPLIST